MANITDKQMNAKPQKKSIWLSEVAIWGHGSLVARISPSGERLFYFRYYDAAGERCTIPIGTYGRSGQEGMMSLAEAGLKAKELAALHKSGILDIRKHIETEQATLIAQREAKLAKLKAEKAARDAELIQQAARKNVRTLFEHWMKIDLVNRKDQGAEIRRMFKKDVLPMIGDMAVADVRKGHITEVTDALLERGVNRMARLIFSLLRQMFRFAVDRDLTEVDPTAGIRKAKIGTKEIERDRVLSEDEIRELARQLPNAGLLFSSEAAIWIVLSTCCRIGELLSAKWEDFDWKEQTWTIPAANSKNGKAHTISLSSFSLVQFQKIFEVNGSSVWCFPNRDDKDCVCSKTVTKQLGDRQRTEEQGRMSSRSKNSDALLLPGGKWTPQDLRRTGATLMTALGVLPEVAERCLNHIEENKVKRVYQRYSYAKEMKEAWDMLGRHLESLAQN